MYGIIRGTKNPNQFHLILRKKVQNKTFIH